MDNYDYKTALLESIKTKTGLDLTWADFTVSNPVSTSGVYAFVTIAPTSTAKFSGTVRVRIKRMVVDNQTLVYTKYDGTTKYGSDGYIIRAVPTTAKEFLALLSVRLGFEVTADDFNIPALPTKVEQETVCTLTAKATSRFFYGTLKVRFVMPLDSALVFECNPATPIVITKASLGSTAFAIDGTPQDMTLTQWTVPAGKHTLQLTGLKTAPTNLGTLTPTKLITFRYFETNGNMQSIFQSCTTLTEIAEEAIYTLGGKFTSMFQGCTNLKVLPNKLFAPGSAVDVIDKLLMSTGVSTIPVTLFNGLVHRGTALDSIFASCSALTAVTVGVFASFTTVKTITNLYANTGVVIARKGVFNGFSALTGETGTFMNCSKLTTVEAEIYTGLPLATNLGSTFTRCTALVTVNAPLLPASNSAGSLAFTFDGCSALKAIPENILLNGGGIGTLSGVLSQTGLLVIPPKIFTYVPNAVQITSVFSRCPGIAVIPAELLTLNVKIVRLTSLFTSCTGIKVIPSTLFDTLTVLGVIESIFDGCTGLTGVPPTLFANNINLVQVQRAFRNVTTPFTLPSNFFPGIRMTDITGVFDGSGLTAIGDNFLGSNPKLNKASRAFARTKITVIPTGLLSLTDPMTVDVSFMFEGCPLLETIKANAILIDATAISIQNVLMNSMFENCVKLKTVEVRGVFIRGSISTMARALYGCSSIVYGTVEFRTRFDIRVPQTLTGYHDNTSFCEGVVGLTGNGVAHWNNTMANMPPSAKIKNTDFLEGCILLDDYDELIRLGYAHTKIS